ALLNHRALHLRKTHCRRQQQDRPNFHLHSIPCGGRSSLVVAAVPEIGCLYPSGANFSITPDQGSNSVLFRDRIVVTRSYLSNPTRCRCLGLVENGVDGNIQVFVCTRSIRYSPL